MFEVAHVVECFHVYAAFIATGYTYFRAVFKNIVIAVVR